MIDRLFFAHGLAKAMLAAAAAPFLLSLPIGLHAESADRDRPTQIDSDTQRIDDLKQLSVFVGNVVLTKGSLRVTGDRLEYREDPQGYQYAVVTAKPGALASFRQRRDPAKPDIEETIEGSAERIEYDGKTETVRLITRALVKRLENRLPRDELSGSLIVYDARNATYDVTGGSPDKSGDATGRVRTIIAPRAPTATNTPSNAEPATLSPTRPAIADAPAASGSAKPAASAGARK